MISTEKKDMKKVKTKASSQKDSGEIINNLNNKFENNSLNQINDNINNIKQNNNIISYFSETIKYLQNDNEYIEYQTFITNSKNYIRKGQYISSYQNHYKSFEYDEEEKYINICKQIDNSILNLNNSKSDYNEQDNKIKEYNTNLLRKGFTLLYKDINVNKKNDERSNVEIKEDKEKKLFGCFENLNIETLNNNITKIKFQPFTPLNYSPNKEKKQSYNNFNDSLSKDKESDSTSIMSEKKEENIFDSFEKQEKGRNKEKFFKKDEYLVEMFGRRGWICISCNNFNYETRYKCNRCGILKNPKKIEDFNLEKKKFSESKEIKNRKRDWICLNCGNLNFSFRSFCNRCRIPKSDPYSSFCINNNEMIYYQNDPFFSFSPSFISFNEVSF